MADNINLSYIRGEMIAAEPPPVSNRNVAGWLRTNLLATPKDVVLTILALALLAFTLPAIFNWLIVQASWFGSDRSVCATIAQGGIQPDGWKGACWAFVQDRFQQFIFGRYPIDERWRVMLVGAMFVVLLVPLMIPKLPHKAINAILLFVVFPVVAFFLLLGGYFGLVRVDTPLWGGMMVTLILSFVGIAVSFPVGILLALGRRSHMPIVKMFCVLFIEVIRGVPLIMVLFMANVMLPLFLPVGWTIDNFLRAVVGVALFASAYMAEVIRGGLQAIPKGQSEGADSLGLSYWQKMRLIVLPQAIKVVIPGIVNTFIGLFKDTSLVAIIGMYDLLNIIRLNFADTTWITPMTPLTGLVTAAIIYWIFCFGMSRYSAFMERHLDTGHKR
ncbi:ABC transporter permease subunit [Rhizobiales bacterium RZME27]|jgi:general L-amino acid transport system permease protein|uniref:ABC transporter permease subunit n=1 Tax=Endobacterium cereale TaxID=2663029 RepID=A0A6A8A7E3_9HYPH|nr:amino acid ABC transporter permease [Endobacterium cereale]MEB2843697.1 amino acid ABC transporter permease [Endobacterium cereale]MQY45560.1 ABC transporter permease subunit [Endobacterium cereale]